ncbi:uncharacterized protein UTRI_03971_B [Ustilago trichophora]|uniref:Uncharacterized protein n=1 Tax=Ustilago trichophora TaxID=86804 RepID=A0A5C3EBW1_9BASI|nr:uncharacterized protein UTRI_03971_B [Ustilago trichophora]
MSSSSKPDQLVVALLNRASTNHRLTILSKLVSDTSSPFELVAERSLRLSLPEDDGLLRSFLAHEIETQGEAETLVRWALKFTATNNFFFVLQLKANSDAPTTSIHELFVSEHASKLWESYGQDEIYVSPDQATAEMQVELLFPESSTETIQGHIDVLAHQLASSSVKDVPQIVHAASSSEDGSGFSQASVLSSGSTAATSVPSVRSQSRASAHPTSANGGNAFKARAIPSTVKSKPSIEPRLSKAAALRMGISLDSPARRTASPSKPIDAANVGISGVAKRPVQQLASLKAPSIAPRLNKAAVARQGGPVGGEANVVRRPASVAGNNRPSSVASSSKAFPSSSAASSEAAPRARKEVDFSNTPGHKRLSLVGSIASTAPPSIAPRQNRASMSRIQGITTVASPRPAPTGTARPPPSAYTGTAGRMRSSSLAGTSEPAEEAKPRKAIDFAQTPGHKRASLSLSIPSLAAPSLAPRQNRASLARTRPSLSTASSSPAPSPSPRTLTKPLPNVADATGKENRGQPRQPTDFATVPGHKRHSLSFALASLKQPSIQPRLNKAAGARIGAGGVKPSS